jgi:hypothetical protein
MPVQLPRTERNFPATAAAQLHLRRAARHFPLDQLRRQEDAVLTDLCTRAI